MCEGAHNIGVYYCIEVDAETSMDLGKVAFFVKAPLAITLCKRCNKIIDKMSTDPLQNRTHVWNYPTSLPGF